MEEIMAKINLNLRFNHKTDQKSNTKFSYGFNIMELMITLTIITVVASLVIPSFANIIQNARIRSASVELSTILALSRHHALSSGVTVIVCQAKDPSMRHCSDNRKRNTRWSSGVISYADLNGDNSLDTRDQILTTIQSHKSVSLVFNQNGMLRFFADGSARSAGFYLCSKSSERERHLKILHTGRARTSAKMSDLNRQTCLSKAE
jgi:type IV fimbrial biogenesis protein FimT